ncbi:MAG: nucleotidyltransferase family protein [Bacteroidia bacterium]|nr:nucleotidyltransferase family protein [Bacteroidia bacterium]
MINLDKHIISSNVSVKDALVKLNELAADAILFVVDEKNFLIGSLTDGDIRRGLINDISTNENILKFIQKNPKYLRKGNEDIFKVLSFKENNYRIIPILNKDNDEIIKIINFRKFQSYLPIDAVIMAGGRGQRLKPLTDQTPKPLLKVGDKPIIEHNINRLINFGIDDIHISVKYLGEQIVQYFGDGADKGVSIEYVWENEPLGTIGAMSKISEFVHNYILLTNSDLLTDLNYEDFFVDFIEKDADFSIATIPYDVNIPYAVLEFEEDRVKNFKEKPTYTYYSNGGIYLMKKEIVDLIPKDEFFNATDLLEKLINMGKKIVSYPLRGYWLDVGKHEDFIKAQEDIKHLKL